MNTRTLSIKEGLVTETSIQVRQEGLELTLFLS